MVIRYAVVLIAGCYAAPIEEEEALPPVETSAQAAGDKPIPQPYDGADIAGKERDGKPVLIKKGDSWSTSHPGAPRYMIFYKDGSGRLAIWDGEKFVYEDIDKGKAFTNDKGQKVDKPCSGCHDLDNTVVTNGVRGGVKLKDAIKPRTSLSPRDFPYKPLGGGQ
jgi:hypothetical protein